MFQKLKNKNLNPPYKPKCKSGSTLKVPNKSVTTSLLNDLTQSKATPVNLPSHNLEATPNKGAIGLKVASTLALITQRMMLQ